MGNFKIEIEAVGSHGFSRETPNGETINYNGDNTDPDTLAFKFTKELSDAGNNVILAELTHWPSYTPIVDDLKRGVRALGDFITPWDSNAEPVLRFFVERHTADGQDVIARMYTQFAYALVRRLARSPERTLALRELLASYDNAKRSWVR